MTILNVKFVHHEDIKGTDSKYKSTKEKDSTYLIIIHPKLIRVLYIHAQFVVSYSIIFKIIERNNKIFFL